MTNAYIGHCLVRDIHKCITNFCEYLKQYDAFTTTRNFLETDKLMSPPGGRALTAGIPSHFSPAPHIFNT